MLSPPNRNNLIHALRARQKKAAQACSGASANAGLPPAGQPPHKGKEIQRRDAIGLTNRENGEILFKCGEHHPNPVPDAPMLIFALRQPRSALTRNAAPEENPPPLWRHKQEEDYDHETQAQAREA